MASVVTGSVADMMAPKSKQSAKEKYFLTEEIV
jgi:hypothetical protein